jgi:hypothetical protein
MGLGKTVRILVLADTATDIEAFILRSKPLR